MNVDRQQGMTLIGFLLLLGAALFVAYIGMKLVPIYINHYNIVSAMKGVAEEPGASNMSERRLRDLMQRRLSVNYVRTFNASQLRIEKGTRTELVIEYEVREPLIGNIDAVVSFKRAEPLE